MEIKRFRADWRHVVETEFDDAQYVGVKDFDRILAERDALQQRLNELGEQHQGEPVAYAVFADNGNIRIWSTKVMQEEGKQVVPLYAHSAPPATGEVERLKSTAEHFTVVSIKAAEEVSRLRAKLIELESSVREFLRIDGLSVDGSAARNKALKMLAATLSASAEPSAPVECDELKPCPFCGCQVTLLTGAEDIRITGSHDRSCPFLDLDVIVDGRDAWQARAALDRKP